VWCQFENNFHPLVKIRDPIEQNHQAQNAAEKVEYICDGYYDVVVVELGPIGVRPT
jgi:hypothetical protein